MKKIFFVFISFILVGLNACSSDDTKEKYPEIPHDPAKALQLTEFLPETGGMASQVIIKGSNFGTDPTKLKVYFNQKPAKVVKTIGNLAYVITPRLPGDTCVISVVIGKDSLHYEKPFYYQTLVRVSTISGVPSEKQTVDGTLVEARFDNPFYLVVDKEKNILVGEWKARARLINEERNSVVTLMNVSTSGEMMSGCTDYKNEVIYFPMNGMPYYYEFDPEQQWTPRRINPTIFPGDEIDLSGKYSFISGLLESGELFSPLRLTAEEAYIVLKEIEIYEEAGIMCRVPDWWRKKSNSIGITMKVGEKEPSKIGLSAIMDFSPSLNLDGEEITEAELKEFLKMAEGLVKYKGKWVEINKEKLKTVLEAFERVKDFAYDEELSLSDAMRMELNMNNILELPSDEIEVSVSNGQWLRKLRETMLHPDISKKINTVKTFHAKLREYQKKGYNWLNNMWQFGFGACLADDMGLGKTVQMIAFLEYHRVHTGGQALLILPTSLIGNWQKEIERFSPEMPYQILHKSDLKSSVPLQYKEGKFLYITTYGMAVRLDVSHEA